MAIGPTIRQSLKQPWCICYRPPGEAASAKIRRSTREFMRGALRDGVLRVHGSSKSRSLWLSEWYPQAIVFPDGAAFCNPNWRVAKVAYDT